jgi:hypothetical protein
LDEWARLGLTLQQTVGNQLSRLTVATVIAEVRRNLRQSGEEESLDAVTKLATEQLRELLDRSRHISERARPGGLYRTM